MHYLTNLWREMRAYPLIGIVTVIGTALSLFLVMLVVMIKAVDVIPVAPILLGWLGADMLWMNSQYSATSSFVTLSEILDWRLFLWALAVCFVLNLLSNAIPALKAARQNPVEAIGGLHK